MPLTKIRVVRAGNSDIDSAKTHFSLGLPCVSCRWPFHTGTGGGCGVSSAINPEISVYHIVGMADRPSGRHSASRFGVDN